MKTDNTLQELLPCPFCGGTETRICDIGREHPYVACDADNCGAFGPEGTCESTAIAAWNTRAQPAPAAGVAERAHAAAVMALEFATHYRDGRNLMCVSETEFSDGLRGALLAALPAPSVGEDELIQKMLHAYDNSGRARMDNGCPEAMKAALQVIIDSGYIAAGVIRGDV